VAGPGLLDASLAVDVEGRQVPAPHRLDRAPLPGIPVAGVGLDAERMREPPDEELELARRALPELDDVVLSAGMEEELERLIGARPIHRPEAHLEGAGLCRERPRVRHGEAVLRADDDGVALHEAWRPGHLAGTGLTLDPQVGIEVHGHRGLAGMEPDRQGGGDQQSQGSPWQAVRRVHHRAAAFRHRRRRLRLVASEGMPCRRRADAPAGVDLRCVPGGADIRAEGADRSTIP